MSFVYFEPEAEAELLETFSWYRNIGNELARKFLADVDKVIAVLQDWPGPESFPLVHGVQADKPIRKARLKKFPYALIFVQVGDSVQTIAVTHLKRRPLYWKSRLPKGQRS